jgi:hypothetical protein
MQIINFHLVARIPGKFGNFDLSLDAPSFYDWAPTYPAKFNNLKYVEYPHRVTVGRLNIGDERYNRDFLMLSTWATGGWKLAQGLTGSERSHR